MKSKAQKKAVKKQLNYLEEQRALLKEARTEAQELIENAKKQADIQREEIIMSARSEADRLKESAKLEIEQEKEKALLQYENKLLHYLY